MGLAPEARFSKGVRMKPNRSLRAANAIAAAVALCILAHVPTAAAQEHPSSVRSADSPPRYINVVHEALKPGRAAAYEGVLSSIRRDYERFDIAAYWVELKSLTGPDEGLALNFFESFDDAGKIAGAIGSAVVAHPELAALQDRLLEENVSSVTNFIAERVDVMSSRADTIHFAKMRLLVVTVFHILPDHEQEFVNDAQGVVFEYDKVEGSPAWVMYAVTAGASAPSYIMLTPLNSLKDEDAAAARREPTALGGAAVDLRKKARSAMTNIYIVNPESSHMPRDFTALDPAFWTAKLSSTPTNKTQ
jgi:hypothetical protein